MVTKEAFDGLAKQVADIADLAKKGLQDNQEQVAALVKDAIENHPGFTPARKIKFEGNALSKDMAAVEVMESAPAEVQKEMDNIFILSSILKRPAKTLKSWGKFERLGREFVKAMADATSGEGADWVPTDFSPNLYELVRLSGKVLPLFPSLDMPSNPYKVPVQLGRMSTFKQPEQTANTGQVTIPLGDPNPLTGNLTFTAQGHATAVMTSKDLEEDSIVPVLPFLQREIAKALAEGREDAVLNGDTTGTHQDSDVTTASDRRKLWIGLRKAALAGGYKVDVSTFNTAGFRSIRKQMKKYGVNPNDCAIIVGVSGYMQMLGLPEIITMEKYGPLATILQGELGKFDGMPVIVSEFVRENLNASGVYDGTTVTKTVVHIVNRNAWAVGVKRGVSIQLLKELYALSDQDALVVRERLDFEPIYPTATNPTVALGYNLLS